MKDREIFASKNNGNNAEKIVLSFNYSYIIDSVESLQNIHMVFFYRYYSIPTEYPISNYWFLTTSVGLVMALFGLGSCVVSFHKKLIICEKMSLVFVPNR